jgi:thioredoxin-like negative regulator of GroEL
MRFMRSPLAKSLLLLGFLAALSTSLAAAEKKPTLLFFMNPAGRPCQTQDQILAEGRNKWESRVALRYVRTDVQADRDAFYQYGVRSLPSLILVGADGKEITRYSPGIQNVDAVLAGIPAKSGR